MVERKRNDLYKTLQQKQQTLDQEWFDKKLEKVRLMDKIKDQEQEILKFQCSGNNNPIQPDKGALANPASSSNPFKAVQNKSISKNGQLIMTPPFHHRGSHSIPIEAQVQSFVFQSWT